LEIVYFIDFFTGQNSSDKKDDEFLIGIVQNDQVSWLWSLDTFQGQLD